MPDVSESAVIDTLDSGNEALFVVLYGDNTWRYVRNREIARDSTIFEKYWDTTTLFPYKDANLAAMPSSVVLELVDSTRSYHCPYQATPHPRGRYGLRRGRAHQGIDLPLKTGDTVYAAFSGRVRISEYNRGGYGNLVIIRHDNGLETYYGHLSERLVEPNQWVEAGQDFEDELANEKQDKKEAAEQAARRYHKIRSGDTLGHIAIRYGTTVSRLCALNGITRTTTLRIGRTLRVR